MKPNKDTRASVQKQIRLFTDGSGPVHAAGLGGVIGHPDVRRSPP
jgi:hypothetical protein